MKQIAILFSGNGTNFDYIAKELHNKKLQIALALTNNPDAKGIDVAKKHNIKTVIIDSSNKERKEFDKLVVEALSKYKLDLVVLAGFMRILTPIFTQNIKAINLHPSLLPRHKGLHAIERSFEDSFSKGGVSVHYVTSKLDDGEIIVQKSIDKSALDFNEYYNKIRTIEKVALKEAILKVLEIK
jgi:phosphoribosylglycinamide formyltransferase-1